MGLFALLDRGRYVNNSHFWEADRGLPPRLSCQGSGLHKTEDTPAAERKCRQLGCMVERCAVCDCEAAPARDPSHRTGAGAAAASGGWYPRVCSSDY